MQIYKNTLTPQTRKIKKNKHSVLHIDRIKKQNNRMCQYYVERLGGLKPCIGIDTIVLKREEK